MAQVILTGFMATGKTAVGRRLARLLGCPFVDTDGLVEAAAGRSIADIFTTEGEARFRALERDAIAQACAVENAVVATGGGALLDPENRRRLAAAGPIVCLAADPEVILRRIGNPASRPLLADGNGQGDGLARIRTLLAERTPAYALAAHTIDTSGLTVEEVADRIRALVAGSEPAMASGAVAGVMAERRAEEVVVDLGARSYPVVVGVGVLDEVGERLAVLGFRGRAALVTGERVGALYGSRVEAALRSAGFSPVVVTVPDGEEHKTMSWMMRVQDRLLEARLDRRSPVVALGGGVITDLAGFAAATLLRGLPTALVSTTLVGQVDAAIGGKTGVNHARGKNLIGLFHQPRLVIADVSTLESLPEREVRAGLAEVVKYGVIGDAALFGRLERAPRLGTDADAVALVAACVRQKAAVVAADEREESGGRAVLNFGHTVAHGLEAVTDYREWLHGEAVAIGMVAAARISRGLGRCADGTVGRIEAALKRAGLPTDIPKGIDRSALAAAIRSDKKSTGGKIRFVVVEEIGRTGFVELSSEEIVSRL